jgi:hypothetical protein
VDTADIFDLALDAEDLLESTLTDQDREQLYEIYKNMSGQVRWGRVLDNAFPVLIDLVDNLIEAGEGMTRHGSVWYLVDEGCEDLFEDGDPKAMARRHLLLLLFAKKLLGGLKTRVNQSTKDIRVLSPEEEQDLMETMDQAEELEREIRLDEEAKDSNREEDMSRRTEVAADIDIAPQGECRNGGRHARVTIRWKRKNEELFTETYCRDCNRVIKKTLAAKQSSRECAHPNAEWVEGKEGEEARCSNPGCLVPVADPSAYHWVDAGLEPCGDDPSQDEVIILKTYGEEKQC